MEYVTIPNVELVSTGMAWNGVGGPYWLTTEHLADMVAAQDDPLIRKPRLKLGHIDPRFNGGLTSHDPANLDADPAFGTITNLRLVEGGQRVIGDYTEVPADLAAALPSAFPNRSIEWVFDYETEGGRRYRTVLTDVAALGTQMQAVSDLADIVRASLPSAVADPVLEDLEAAAAAKGVTDLPDHPMIAAAEQVAAAAAAGAVTALKVNDAVAAAANRVEQASASVSVDRIAHVFNFEWATDPDSVDGLDTYWWWVRDVRLDPDEVIASDGEGGTWRVPFTTDGEHTVTFGEPVEVRETYVDVAAATAAASAAQARHGQQVLARNLERPDKPAPDNPAASAATTQKEGGMSATSIDVGALRSRLEVSEADLPDDATLEQINEFLAARQDRPNDPAEDTPEANAETETVVEDLVAATAGREVERLSKELEELKSAQAAREESETKQRRDGLASQWVREGRIAPSDHDHYRELLEVDEQRTVALASALPSGRIPVAETDVDLDDSPAASVGEDGLLPESVSILTPAEREQLRARRGA